MGSAEGGPRPESPGEGLEHEEYDFIRTEAERLRQGGFDESTIRQFETDEGKRQKRREGRLKKIVAGLEESMRGELPEEVERFEIIFKQFAPAEHPIGTRLSAEPVYGIFLRSRPEPHTMFQIMHLFRQDIDKKVTSDKFSAEYQIPHWISLMKEGIEKLKEIQ